MRLLLIMALFFSAPLHGYSVSEWRQFMVGQENAVPADADTQLTAAHLNEQELRELLEVAFKNLKNRQNKSFADILLKKTNLKLPPQPSDRGGQETWLTLLIRADDPHGFAPELVKRVLEKNNALLNQASTWADGELVMTPVIIASGNVSKFPLLKILLGYPNVNATSVNEEGESVVYSNFAKSLFNRGRVPLNESVALEIAQLLRDKDNSMAKSIVSLIKKKQEKAFITLRLEPAFYDRLLGILGGTAFLHPTGSSYNLDDFKDLMRWGGNENSLKAAYQQLESQYSKLAPIEMRELLRMALENLDKPQNKKFIDILLDRRDLMLQGNPHVMFNAADTWLTLLAKSTIQDNIPIADAIPIAEKLLKLAPTLLNMPTNDDNPFTPVMIASGGQKYFPLMRYLLQQPGIDVTTKNRVGYTVYKLFADRLIGRVQENEPLVLEIAQLLKDKNNALAADMWADIQKRRNDSNSKLTPELYAKLAAIFGGSTPVTNLDQPLKQFYADLVFLSSVL